MFIRSGYSAQTRSRRSGTEHHHLGADVFLGRRNLRQSARRQPGRSGLALELLDAETIEMDPINLRRHLARGRHDLALAFELEPFALGADRGRAARVNDAADLTY